jgi:NADH dehydrogenase
MPELNVVTGAFGNIGQYIAERLLREGKEVRTLTRSSVYRYEVKAFPFNFDNPSRLVESLQGATTLYNTYWVRFPYGQATHEKAVENSLVLIKAAEEAGLRRIVNISITNPSKESALSYFKGKALVEKAITQSRLSYAIVRPTVVFGPRSILINNIAWLLKRFPIFPIPGSGDYRIQPVSVEDVVEIAVSAGQKDDNVVVDAVGPEIYTYDELVRLIAGRVHGRAKIIHVRPRLAFFLAKLVGYLVRDVVITEQEIEGLMANLLVSQGSPTGQMRFSTWLDDMGEGLGANYFSELAISYRR